jgi:hypothetical protein
VGATLRMRSSACFEYADHVGTKFEYADEPQIHKKGGAFLVCLVILPFVTITLRFKILGSGSDSCF